MRLFIIGLCLAATMSHALAQQARTTRIETRPYYGAVVTIEHGVRVYRPVPPTTHLIINPDGAASVDLNVGEGISTRRTAGNAVER